MSKLMLFLLFSLVLLSSCSSVQTKKVDDKTFYLTTTYNDPPRNLSSSSLAAKAKELCPGGYDIISKNAGKPAEFGIDDAQCAAYKDCGYALEWRVTCADKPQEAFSLFGRH